MGDIEKINEEMEAMHDLFTRVVHIIPRFDIMDRELLPYGLKPHTRSVSWIVEQVIVQQAKYNSSELGIDDLDFDLPDTSLHDCIVKSQTGGEYFVNIKITNAEGKASKNDISAVEKLYMQYKENPDYRLIFVVFPFTFSNTTITLEQDSIHVFSPQFLPVYVNPRNDKIQALYHAPKEERTRGEFIKLLVDNSRSIKLK